MFSKVKYFVIVGLMFIGGCASMPKSVDEAVMVMDKAAKIAERNGAAWTAKVIWDGTIGPEHSEKIVIDTGVTLEFTAHGNAASERPSTSKDND